MILIESPVKTLQIVFPVLGMLLCAGCVNTAERLAKVEPGMSREQVVAIAGEPVSSSKDNVQEMLLYVAKVESERVVTRFIRKPTRAMVANTPGAFYYNRPDYSARTGRVMGGQEAVRTTVTHSRRARYGVRLLGKKVDGAGFWYDLGAWTVRTPRKLGQESAPLHFKYTPGVLEGKSKDFRLLHVPAVSGAGKDPVEIVSVSALRRSGKSDDKSPSAILYVCAQYDIPEWEDECLEFGLLAPGRTYSICSREPLTNSSGVVEFRCFFSERAWLNRAWTLSVFLKRKSDGAIIIQKAIDIPKPNLWLE